MPKGPKFRALSAKEVKALYTIYKQEADSATARMKACETDDKQGIRWLAAKDFEAQSHKQQWIDYARFVLLEMCQEKEEK